MKWWVSGPKVIQDRLDGCSAFIVVMSSRSYESDWVQNELARAKRMRKDIFPILIEGDGPWVSVEATQYFDDRYEDLPDSDFFNRLLSTLLR